jgi:hypothetical protein
MVNSMMFDEGLAWLSTNDFEGTTVHFLLSDLQIKQTYLLAAATLPTGTLAVQSTKGFSDTGTIVVGGESVTYTGRTTTTFTGCTGGSGAIAVNAQVTQSGGLTAASTLAGGVGEITGWTGASAYARKTQAAPALSSGLMVFSAKAWATGSATDGDTNVRTVVACTSADGSGKALCAWHVTDDGPECNMGLANATLSYTPTIGYYNVGAAS